MYVIILCIIASVYFFNGGSWIIGSISGLIALWLFCNSFKLYGE